MNSMSNPWPGASHNIKSAGEQDQQRRNQQYRQHAQQGTQDADESDYKRIDEYA